MKEISRAASAKGVRFELVREGAKHQLWRCGSATTAIPRHSEIGTGLVVEIRKDLEPALGKDWWR